MPTRRIKLTREKENYNKNLEYKVFIDKQEIAHLKNGDSQIIKLKTKAHYLEVRFNSGSSEKIRVDNLKADQELLISGNNFRNKYLKYAGALIPLIGLSFVLKHNYDFIKQVGIFIFVSYCLILIYILIFQKRKWIDIELKD
ncbi:hypothetical protein SAMN04487764_2123 [Gillisia sp. Hel1_33_143]|uniref:hypothetical protein n=1 Tax=Gillisia sp. Hel1_33_143 TaxID=1336796 RepID=UPI000879A8D0|nr:hypothetical protein [Gillisia sp. Hel1_33_143]SDS39638.1 hypothetical protein SAMN04487764_2123 [Gillisia sp. Hel1_33_143]